MRSVGYGWGILIVAGAGSYYFAKRSVNSDRTERAEAEERRRQQRERMRVQELVASRAAARKAASENPSPSRSGEADPAPVGHAEVERPQFEAKEPFRSRKGDRFS